MLKKLHVTTVKYVRSLHYIPLVNKLRLKRKKNKTEWVHPPGVTKEEHIKTISELSPKGTIKNHKMSDINKVFIAEIYQSAKDNDPDACLSAYNKLDQTRLDVKVYSMIFKTVIIFLKQVIKW
jgi:hypothetical protein